MSRASASCKVRKEVGHRDLSAAERGEHDYGTVDDVFEALYREELGPVDAARELELLQKRKYPLPVRVMDFLSR